MSTGKVTRKTRSRIIIPVVIIVGLVAAMAIVLVKNKKQIVTKESAVAPVVNAMPVKIAMVQQKRIENQLLVTGAFVARQTLPLVAQAQGSIISLNIKEGQQIGAGQVVAQIDAASLRANLASARATYNNAVKNKERFERLAKAGAISQKQYEDVALNVNSALANVQNIQQQMKYTVIHSPMSGVVSEVKVERGSFATQGMELGSVVDISKLKMVIQVAEQEVVKLKIGQKVAVTTEVYPGQVFNGLVTLVSVQADAGRKYNIEIEVSNDKTFPLKAGMFGTARLDFAGEASNGLFIPRTAIIGSIEKAQVYVLNNDSTVSLKNIQVQNAPGDDVMVLGGIKEAEKIVVSGQINLQEGKKVRVTQ